MVPFPGICYNTNKWNLQKRVEIEECRVMMRETFHFSEESAFKTA